MTTACTHCHAPIDEHSAFLDEDGHVCPSCHDLAEIEGGFNKAYAGLATGALGAAVFSFFLNPFFMFTLLALGGAVSTIAYPWRIDPEDRPALKRLRWPPLVAGAAISVALVAIR